MILAVGHCCSELVGRFIAFFWLVDNALGNIEVCTNFEFHLFYFLFCFSVGSFKRKQRARESFGMPAFGEELSLHRLA